MVSKSKIFLLPIQVNFSLPGMFSSCCKVCNEDVTRAENSLGCLLCMNFGSAVDCMRDGSH